MRFQIYFIAALLGLILWVMSFDATQDAYRDFQRIGAIPNLHVRAVVHNVLHGDLP